MEASKKEGVLMGTIDDFIIFMMHFLSYCESLEKISYFTVFLKPFWTWQKIRTANTHSEDAVHLLAFHPCREDRGPGCRANPLDAGHFSVRALWQEGKGVIQHQRVVIFSRFPVNVLHGS